jgi:SDR family mycofactocin-dependent oxidoreductase
VHRFQGKTVLITGAATGQGRSHAVAFAREGADVAVCDICADIDSIAHPLGTAADLDETVRLIEAEGRRAVRGVVDVRRADDLHAFAEQTVAELGQIDVAVAKAGIFASPALLHELDEQAFDDMIGVNLKGVWLTMKAVLPHMIARTYGRIVVTGSTAGLVGAPNFGHYAAAKHALAGLVKTVALEQGANGITANIVAPTAVGTGMILNDALYRVFDENQPTQEAFAETLTALHAIPRPWLDPDDVTKVVLFLASDDARSTTGSVYKVDMGWTAQ